MTRSVAASYRPHMQPTGDNSSFHQLISHFLLISPKAIMLVSHHRIFLWWNMSMIIAWMRWPWRGSQGQQQWPQHGVLVCVSYQLSDVGKGQLKSRTNRICLFIVLLFAICRLCQGDGSFTESLGTNILWPHAKLLPVLYCFVEVRKNSVC